MSDETQDEAPQVVFAFAEGQEVLLPGRDGVVAKVVNQAVDEDGRPLYEVVYAARETLREDELAPKVP